MRPPGLPDGRPSVVVEFDERYQDVLIQFTIAYLEHNQLYEEHERLEEDGEKLTCPTDDSESNESQSGPLHPPSRAEESGPLHPPSRAEEDSDSQSDCDVSEAVDLNGLELLEALPPPREAPTTIEGSPSYTHYKQNGGPFDYYDFQAFLENVVFPSQVAPPTSTLQRLFSDALMADGSAHRRRMSKRKLYSMHIDPLDVFSDIENAQWDNLWARHPDPQGLFQTGDIETIPAVKREPGKSRLIVNNNLPFYELTCYLYACVQELLRVNDKSPLRRFVPAFCTQDENLQSWEYYSSNPQSLVPLSVDISKFTAGRKTERLSSFVVNSVMNRTYIAYPHLTHPLYAKARSGLLSGHKLTSVCGSIINLYFNHLATGGRGFHPSTRV